MACLQFGAPFKVVACTSTPTTVCSVKAPTNQAVKCLGINIGFDGTNSAQGPAIVEVCSCTFASAGTSSTTITLAAMDTGRPELIQSAGKTTYTVEPTVVAPIETFLVPVYMGSAIVFRPLTVPLIAKGGSGIVVRVTLPSGVTANASGDLACEE